MESGAQSWRLVAGAWVIGYIKSPSLFVECFHRETSMVAVIDSVVQPIPEYLEL